LVLISILEIFGHVVRCLNEVFKGRVTDLFGGELLLGLGESIKLLNSIVVMGNLRESERFLEDL